MDDESHSLGSYIQKLRKARNWSRKELARRIGVSAGQIDKLEEEMIQSPGFPIIIAMARVFQVPIVKFVYAYEGRDPDSIPDADLADVSNILDQVLSLASQKRGIPG
jgi:transcriptional regulator with XRE-family HTH domain